MTEMDIMAVLQHVPQRFPFLLVDRITEFEAGRRIVALKNVTVNEPFFPGHFPYKPIMPGVLILEAMAQAASILAFRTMETRRGVGVLLRRHRQRPLQTPGRAG